MMRKLTVALASFLACGLFAAVFVNLTVDPPEVVSEWPCVSDCQRDASGVSFAIDDASFDLDFSFIGLPEEASVSYVLLAGGAVVEVGDGTRLPLSSFPDADAVRFLSADASVDWGAVTSVRARRAAHRDRARPPSQASPAAAATVATAEPVSLTAAPQEADGPVYEDFGAYTVSVSIGPSTDGFTVFGLGEPGGTTTADDFTFSVSGPGHTNAFSYTAHGGKFKALKTGFFSFQVAADDEATVHVGDLAVSATWPDCTPGETNTVLMRRGEVREVSASGGSVGGPAFLEKVLWGAFTPYDESAALVVTPAVATFSPRAVTSSDVVVAYCTSTNEGYVVSCESADPGLETTADTARPAPGSSWWTTNDEAKVTFVLTRDGEVKDRGSAVFRCMSPKAWDECDECCGEGTSSQNGCVAFSQRFGRSPWLGGLPTGALRIVETRPLGRLWTTRALRYDHPMMRRIVSRSWGEPGLDVVIREPDGNLVEYRGGFPAGVSKGMRTGLTVNGDGNVVEVLADRTRVEYGPGGCVVAIAAPDADWIPVSDLGIAVTEDASGAVASVVSRADGRIDVSATGTNTYEAVWRAPDGAVVKTFAFSGNGSDVFELAESRPGGAAAFVTRWTWVPTQGDWVMTKAPGLPEAMTEARSLSYDPTNRTFAVERYFEDASGGRAVAEASTIDAAGGVSMLASRTSGGRCTYSAVRDPASGRLASETDARGATTEYAYDAYGRTVLESRAVGGGLPEETRYGYTAEAPQYGDVDRRPRRVVRTLGGVTVSDVETHYESNRTSRVRRGGGAERTSFSDRDALGRTILIVEEDGRATATAYSAVADDLSWTRTTTEGVWRDGAFAPVPGKSGRRIEAFDGAGNVLRTTTEALVGDAWHETGWITNRYNTTHKVVYGERSDGRTSSAEWICTGPVWRTDEDGVTVSNRYDGVKRRVASTRHSPHGARTTEYAYDAAGRIVREIEHAEGCNATNAVTRAYDERGRIVSETDAAGAVTLTAYSGDGRTTTVTHPDGGTRVTALNADGSLASVTGTAVTPEFHTYGVTADGLEWTQVNYGREDSPRYERTYRNGFGETVRTERSGFGGATLVTEHAYDGKGRLVSTTETGRPTVAYAYDDWGDCTNRAESAGGVTRTTARTEGCALIGGEVWRGSAQAVSTSDATIAPLVTASYSRVSGLTLDRIAEGFTVNARGNTNRTWSALDPAAARRTEWTRRAGVGNVSFSESVDGATVRTVDSACVTNTAAYDAFRRRVATTDGRGNTTSYAYDASGRLAAVTDAATNATHYAYDAMGRIAEVTNALGGVTVTRYDLRGNRTYEGGATYPVSYAYDAYGSRTSMTTCRDEGGAGGDTTTWAYDEASGLVTQKLYADGRGPTYAYTADGKLATRIWARGVTTSYAYDAWGNLVSTTYSDGTPSVTFAYDALGRRASVTDAKGTTVFSCDAFGDESRETTTGLYSKTLVRHRDAYGRDLGHTLDGSRKNIIEYDSATGRIKREQLGGAWFTWSYHPGTHLRSRLTYGASGYTDWTYEPNRDLLTQVRNCVYGSVVSQYDYANDALGRRTAVGRSGTMTGGPRSDAYGYNDRSELVSAAKDGVGEYAYQYDDIGNRLSSLDLGTNRTYTANVLNQYTQITSLCDPASLREEFIPQFDADGNQTLIQTATGVWSVTYNGENRPVSWTCGATNLTMRFDYMGRRAEYLETTANEDSIVTNKHQYFVYDGYLCLQIVNAQTGVAEYAFEWDPTEPVATRPMVMQRTGNWNLFYTHDGNKNVSELVYYQRARGVAARDEYAPFGAVTVRTRGDNWGTLDFSSLNPFRFSSEFADDALGLVYYNYRHYDPVTGRWLSRDPVEEEGGIRNIYSFLGNTVVQYSDWLGQVPILPLFTSALRTAVREMVKGMALSLIPSWYDTIRDEGSLVWDAALTGCGNHSVDPDDNEGFHEISLNSPRDTSALIKSLRAGLKRGSTALISQFSAGYLSSVIRWEIEDNCRICAIVKESFSVEITVMGEKQPSFIVDGPEKKLKCFDYDELGKRGPAGREARVGCRICPCNKK